MANILYVDSGFNSTDLIEYLDMEGIEYELRSECEAKEKGYKVLPVLIYKGKKLEYKKAKRLKRE